jgi:hypothetical protein
VATIVLPCQRAYTAAVHLNSCARACFQCLPYTCS